MLHRLYGDCTAFENKGSKHQIFGDMLTEFGYHGRVTRLYNGMTGTDGNQHFYWPLRHMRLKHMVKDKINYRAGKRTL